MNALAEEGVVVLGGPVGAGDGQDALLVVDLPDEAAIHALLADEPWQANGIVTTRRVEPWTVLLRAGGE